MVRTILRVPLLLLLLVLLLPFSSIIAAPALAPGSLDATFGTGGKVTTNFGGSDLGYSMAIQSDGRIIIAGYTFIGSTFDFAVARYNTNGSLDTTFGAGGKVVTDFGGSDVGQAVAIQSDGRIIVAGNSGFGFPVDFAVARYNSDGTLDTAFGAVGKVITDFQGMDDYGNSVAIQSDGRIIVAGSAATGLDSDFALARYSANGSLDTTFGAMGKLTTDFGLGDTRGQSVAIQSDGRIIIAGYSSAGSTLDFALARYKADGTLDTTFGAGGKVTTDFGVNEGGASVAVQEDGKIIVAGYTFIGSAMDIALARYKADGTLDTTFGAGGKVTADFGASEAGASVAIQEDGRIVVAGNATAGGSYDFALVRYNINGSLDTSFGTGGHVTTDFGSDDFGTSVAVQSDGRLVVAGRKGPAFNEDFALARYLDGAALPPTPTPTPVPPTPTATLVPGVTGPGLAVMAGLLLTAFLWAYRRHKQQAGI